MQKSLAFASCCGRPVIGAHASGADAVRPALPMDSISSRPVGCLAGRRFSHILASTSGRDVARRRGRSRLQVDAALFEPPPFQPSKLSVQYLRGAAVSSASFLRTLPACRRYTLTHNDITGALQLSIGSDYNQRQVQGFYTRILRDEITAEWLFGQGGAAPAELHIYCHVSGEERWLAPPQLRNFIFRREMTLVLDTFMYADKQLLQAFPDLLRAKVYVHFQSDVQDLDLREYWGVLGQRATWRRMPKGVLARLKLLLFGFPALPHSRPRHALTHQQQQQQQGLQQQPQGDVQPQHSDTQQAPGVLVPAAATAAATAGTAGTAAGTGQNLAVAESPSSSSSSSTSGVQHQWHPQAELAVEATRAVALSLHEQRQAQQQHGDQQQLEQQQQDAQALHIQSEQNRHAQQHLPCSVDGAPQQIEPCSCAGCCQDGYQEASGSNGSSAAVGSNGSSAQALHCQQQQQQLQAGEQDVQGVQPPPQQQQCTQAAQGDNIQQQQQQQQWPVLPQAPPTDQFEQQAALVDALLEYGRWSPAAASRQQDSRGTARMRQLVQASASSSNGISGSSGSSIGGNSSSSFSAAMLGGPTALQLVLQQKQEQMLLKTATCTAVVMATANVVVDASSSTAGRCQ